MSEFSNVAAGFLDYFYQVGGDTIIYTPEDGESITVTAIIEEPDFEEWSGDKLDIKAVDRVFVVRVAEVNEPAKSAIIHYDGYIYEIPNRDYINSKGTPALEWKITAKRRGKIEG